MNNRANNNNNNNDDGVGGGGGDNNNDSILRWVTWWDEEREENKQTGRHTGILLNSSKQSQAHIENCVHYVQRKSKTNQRNESIKNFWFQFSFSFYYHLPTAAFVAQFSLSIACISFDARKSFDGPLQPHCFLTLVSSFSFCSQRRRRSW